MINHLKVEFDHEPATEIIEGTASCVNAPGNIDLPDNLHERILSSARVNALTEIESLITELKELGPDAQCLTDKLENLLERNDMDDIFYAQQSRFHLLFRQCYRVIHFACVNFKT